MKEFKNTESISINTTQKDGRGMSNKVMKVVQKVTYALSNNSGQGALDSAVISVLHCYDKIITIRKRVNNRLIMIRFGLINLLNRSKIILSDQRGEGTVSQAISILTAVVLGSLLLMGLYKLIQEIVLPLLQERIMEMFNYSS